MNKIYKVVESLKIPKVISSEQSTRLLEDIIEFLIKKDIRYPILNDYKKSSIVSAISNSDTSFLSELKDYISNIKPEYVSDYENLVNSSLEEGGS